MKNIFIYISLAVLSVLFYGCSFSFGNKYQRYADFPVKKNLVLSEDIYCGSIFLRYPYRIEIKDSLAVILDLHPDSCFYMLSPIRNGSISFRLVNVVKVPKKFFLPNV